MSETTPLIKAALNLRVGVGFDVYGQSARRVGLFSMGKITSRNRKSRGLSLNENLSAM